jgi:hypothetical protein
MSHVCVTGRNAATRTTLVLYSARRMNQISEGLFIMRNVLLAGTAGLFLALGAVGAANANNPNVPVWSPLSINTDLGRPMHRYRAHRMTEGRAAYTKPAQPDQIFSDGSSDDKHLVNPDLDTNPANASGAIKNEEPMADQ